MNNKFLKGMYYIPKDKNENPYDILKNANKNKFNFVIIEYSNIDLFDKLKLNQKEVSRLLYIQDKIKSFEKKHKNTIGIICFKCRSLIGSFRILLSKSIFDGDIFKLKNFYLWCYINDPILILSNNNFSHIENSNLKKFFKIYTDNFLKTTDNYINLLNKDLKLSPMFMDNSFIFIKNMNSSNLDFSNLKPHIEQELKNGDFFVSSSDKIIFDFNIDHECKNSSINVNTKDSFLNIDIKINNFENNEQKIIILSNKNDIIKEYDFYDLRQISYNSQIKKNSAIKFLILKLISKNNSIALTPPIYIKN